MPRLSDDEKKRREKAEKDRLRKEEERKRLDEERRERSISPRRRGRPSTHGGVMAPSPTPEAPDATIAPVSIPNHSSISGGAYAISPAPGAPVATIAPSSIPSYIIPISQHQSAPNSSQGCANGASGGVQTQELSRETSGLRPGSVPPSVSPTSRRGPSSDSRGQMDVDMETDTISAVMANINDFHINSSTNTPMCRISARNHSGTPKRRRGPGSWKAQLKRRNSSRSIRSDRASKRRRMEDQRMLATINAVQTLSILSPKTGQIGTAIPTSITARSCPQISSND